jgi:hypothetical protein
MHGQWLSFRTMTYFFIQGVVYGVGVGGLCGTLIVPVAGTILGSITGGWIGMVLGVITGIVVAVLNRWLLHPDVDVMVYRRKLTRYTGLLSLVLIGGLILIQSASNMVNVYPHTMQGQLTAFVHHSLGFLAFMLAFVIPVSVSIAYSASYYADLRVAPLVKKKNDEIGLVELPEHPGAVTWFADIAFRKSCWLMLAGALVGGFVHHQQIIEQNGWALHFGAFVSGAVVGTLVVLAVSLVLIIVNSFVLTLAHRLYFDEYGRHLSLAQYKRRLMILLALVTLVYGVVITVGLFAPLAALVAALSAREYADRHYGSAEKLKRSSVA